MITMSEAEDYLGPVLTALDAAGLRPDVLDVPDTDDLAEDGIVVAPSAVLVWNPDNPQVTAEPYRAGLLAAWSAETGWSYAALRPDGSNSPRAALGLPVLAEPERVAAVLARAARGLDGDAPVLVLSDGTGQGWERRITAAEDPGGWVLYARDAGYLDAALTALGDPMGHALARADDPEAAAQLRAVSWLVDLLNHRRDALIVALKARDVSWSELARLTDPDEPDPARLRTKVRRRHEAGLRRADLLPQDDGHPHTSAFEAVMIAQITAAIRRADQAAATRLVDHLLLESADPAATEARVQAAIARAAGA
ncbi:hypothetical protein [Kitasatospora sp. NBC_01300]|uniref:hypothetical protein n=1 Tax=Kitasatospora sp. NBC_01300 TaxID=2903574 RepID=UPI002F911899|nr:hypothetical protein OG556_40120 [Kitasatospora sp. NBC_01300]